jgi:hypothetical protein
LAINKLNTDLNFIQKLDDEPNDVGGLSSDQLKAEFDKAGNAVKSYINNTIVPAVNNLQTQTDAATAVQHTHSNKALLDTYTQPNASLKMAVDYTHEHVNAYAVNKLTEENIAVLGKITDVTQTLGNATNKVPSEKAVADAMAANGNIPSGGTKGQALVKASNTARDVTWKTIDAAAVGALPSTTKATDIGGLPATATAADVGALSTAGGKLTGSLDIAASSPAVRLDHSGQNARAAFSCVGHSLTLSMYDVAGATNNARQLYVRDASGSFSSLDRMIEMYVTTNGSSKYYKVLTEANKPAGATYKGTAAARTVAVGGIGGVILVRSAAYTALVTAIGAHIFSNSTVMVQPNSGAPVVAYRFVNGITYSNGSLVLDAAQYLNESGTTYTYQVL